MPTDPRRLDPVVVVRELRDDVAIIRKRGSTELAERREEAANLIEHQASEIERLTTAINKAVGELASGQPHGAEDTLNAALLGASFAAARADGGAQL